MNKFWNMTKSGAIDAVRVSIFVISLIGAVVIVIGPAIFIGFMADHYTKWLLLLVFPYFIYLSPLLTFVGDMLLTIFKRAKINELAD